MTRKIFQSIIAVVISVLLLSLALITGVLYNHFETAMLDQLRTTAQFAEQGVEQEGMAYFDSLHAQNCRVTWIAADGTVKYDNRSDPKTMENHADRQEVREAMENDSGTSVRRSSTLSEHTMYYAKRLSDGTVLRLSMSQRSVLFLMGGMLSPLVFIFLAACLLAGVLSYRVSKKIVKPLSEIDLKHPEQVETYDELSPFLQRIAAQNREIDARMAEIRKQQQEFSMITENMSEGLFVVDRNYQILSYNKSAMQIFGMDSRQEHENLLAVNRSEGFRNAVDSALKGRHTQENLELNGRVYQIIANAVCQPDFAEDMVGAVILVLDVTEKEAQEQYRREFTANVSHELKTPLTSISGIGDHSQRHCQAGGYSPFCRENLRRIPAADHPDRGHYQAVPSGRKSGAYGTGNGGHAGNGTGRGAAAFLRCPQKRCHAGGKRYPRAGAGRAAGAGGNGV